MNVHYKRSQLSLYSSSDFFILHVYQADTLTTYSQYQLYPTYNLLYGTIPGIRIPGATALSIF